VIQLKIRSGKTAGATWVARRFPVRIGRAPGSDLCLEEDGVWDQHLVLEVQREEGFVLSTQPGALARVNGEQVQQGVLRNGDTIEIGAVTLQFWLGEVRQSGLRLREALAWTVIISVTSAQFGLLYWLLR
jgi:pSer/pThr/pTyr-binding forkhead associated (FHA) protein